MWVISTSDWLMLTICTICVVPSVSGSWKAYDFNVLTYYYVESLQQYIPRCKTISNPAAEGRPMAWSYWSCYCIIINSCSSVATAKSIAMVMWNNIFVAYGCHRKYRSTNMYQLLGFIAVLGLSMPWYQHALGTRDKCYGPSYSARLILIRFEHDTFLICFTCSLVSTRWPPHYKDALLPV